MNVRPIRRAPLACALAMLCFPLSALADAVTDWNAIAQPVVAAAGGPPLQFRVMTMTHIAIHDALNAIDPRYDTYTAVPGGSPDASPGAAVARAARDVLRAQVSAQAATVDAAYAAYIAALPACDAAHPTCIADGESIGAAAAAAILALRTMDGSEAPHVPYTLAPAVGVYQPTVPMPPTGPQFGNWGNVRPFAINNADQFGPGHTDFLNMRSENYLRDYLEVKAVGSALVRGAAPDSPESQTARFWPGGGGNYNALLSMLVANDGGDLWQHARVFALMNMAVSDGVLVTFKTKYDHNFWRPYTAIRWPDDGIAGTESDPDWSSYIVTPPYPDYTCGLPNVVGSAISVIRNYFGTDAVTFTVTASGLPPAVTKTFTSLGAAAQDAANARVYGGIHFRTGCEAAVRLGDKVGDFVWRTQLRAH